MAPNWIIPLLFAFTVAAQPPVPDLEPHAFTAEVNLVWNAVTNEPVAFYTVYQGEASRNYYTNWPVGLETNAVVHGLVPGITYFWAVTATGTNLLESDFSNEVTYAVPEEVPPPSLGIETIPMMYVTLEGFDGTNWVPVATFSYVVNSFRDYGLFRTRLAMTNQPAIRWE